MKTVVSLLAAFALVGCGALNDLVKEETQAKKASSEDAVAQSLHGEWETDCLVEIEDGEETGAKAILIVDSKGLSIEHISYLDVGCAKEAFRAKFETGYTLGLKLKEPIGALEIDLKMRKILFATAVEVHVEEYNRIAAFGYKDWKKSEYKDVTGKQPSAEDEKEAMPKEGQETKQIVAVENDELFFGEKDDSSKDETSIKEKKRPTKLDKKKCYKRKKKK